MLAASATSAGARPTFRAAVAPRRPSARRGCTVVRRASWSRQWDQWDEQDAKFVSIFQPRDFPATNNPATAYDCRDALEVCSGLWGEQRRDCLTVFGLDPQQVDMFYTTVMSLETALAQDTDPEEEASHRGQERC